MLATPLVLFAIACAKNSVFLVDSSGALFGIDVVLVLWMRDQLIHAREARPIPIEMRNPEPRRRDSV